MRRPTPRELVRFHLPTLLFCLLIFFVSSLQRPPAPDYGFEWSDKVNHLSAYTILSVLIFRSIRQLQPARSLLWQALATIALTSAYGITDELHQSLVPGRSCELMDWLADLLGSITGVFIARLMFRFALGRAFLGGTARVEPVNPGDD